MTPGGSHGWDKYARASARTQRIEHDHALQRLDVYGVPVSISANTTGNPFVGSGSGIIGGGGGGMAAAAAIMGGAPREETPTEWLHRRVNEVCEFAFADV